MNWEHAKDSLLVGLLSIGVTILGYMAVTVAELNTKLAVVLERTEAQNTTMVDHESRLRDLEKKRD